MVGSNALDIVREREAKSPADSRHGGLHYYSIHKHGVAYDIEVDTSRRASALAMEIIEE